MQKIRHLISRIYKRYGKQQFLKLFRRVQPGEFGINLIGYFSHTSGIAEVGRFFAKRLIQEKFPFLIYDLPATKYSTIDDSYLSIYKSYFSKQTVFFKNIFFVNADMLHNLEYEQPCLFVGRYNAAVFFWEFNDYFDFPQALKVIDEAILFSDFMATAVKKAAPSNIRITKLKFPFSPNWQYTKPPKEIRDEIGIGDNEFVFIFNFDFHSVYERKNPEAIVQAFEQAFRPHDKVRLILKSIHGSESNRNFVKIKDKISQMKVQDKIMLIDGNLDRNSFMTVINACDCYISLHRSEGLGLGMMEAMSMGKPVIATAYGGNMDFTTDENSLLVPYKLVPVEENAGPYKRGWLWADADIQTAASHMRKLYNEPNYAQALGLAAKNHIANIYNPEAFIKELNLWMHA